MAEADVIEIIQLAIWTTLVAAGPSVFAAMFVGVAIALFQALTQVQEITLTFIPKIVVILVTISFSAAFMGAQIGRMTEVLYGRIETGF
ncbi:MAG: flagellar biosynthetic protein FliQ [Roseitalea porphyridii]|jgi:flagellar biosynthetic protein FliQ|uniref:Flagellar export apparatus protein FliQ n=1 Tax=Roseitalea porphyridii TaxID=1852022 RepID=A0A4P6V1Q5_9HYPH|nr:flagellar biosynthetic protein FliQ [Roseitalea porphyridii]QBK30506.1 flagellar export apparatus protein FliQ [Roseitalea porphyridii]